MGTAVIIGAGEGLSAALARKLHARGHKLLLAARNTGKLAELQAETGATMVTCDASEAADMEKVFAEADALEGPLDVAIYNPSARVRGGITDLDPAAVKSAVLITGYGAFLMAQQAAKRMIPQGKGAILFTGASAGVKGYPNSSTFAMGKFALRGLAQSLARELHPQGIHIGHFVIDGGIRNASRPERVETAENPDSMLDPDAIAESYLHFLDQPRSSWAWEIELRPWVEKF
ncbi:SDR family NAD(P)-dependent oxidoreductase [Denitrobaculum tricleocarpae]|uniref:SDR family NAD(P)-dependent oxidoreductase n=1 Tax=Denitrobaculum tricleocarpae TaxID=2591009 RepID=A0A545TF38_9PROT|nr:SDR family NAD(P)-dependent oxidoreductase [Denitrobaculum tricleocarpae]TQV75828.1 SDR family NAD(P)-dependent oxidoreductase [Denitrobaculum tricleocarpae]